MGAMKKQKKTFTVQGQNWGVPVMTGALAGLVASLPMAAVMMGLNRLLPSRGRTLIEPYRALPPKEITLEIAERVGAPEVVRPGRRWGLATWLGHMGYGAATASLYPLLTRRLNLPNVIRGMLFAMLVWAGSYLGWLPAFDVLPPATQQTRRRNVVMILSHLSWGSLTALLSDLLERQFIGTTRVRGSRAVLRR
jgi:uncharacterized membrane protein YagU involved in acid resistance